MKTTNINLDPQVARRNYFKNKLLLVKKRMEETEESDYVINSIYSIYEKLIDHDQFSDMSVSAPTISDKLIRCYRYIPYYEMGDAERVVLGGLFVVAKVCLLPASMVDECTSSNRWGAYLHPEKFGLPSTNEVDYRTIRSVNPETYSVLVKNEWYNGWITHNYQYEVVILNDKE